LLFFVVLEVLNFKVRQCGGRVDKYMFPRMPFVIKMDRVGGDIFNVP
jgi:hypothetical protein